MPTIHIASHPMKQITIQTLQSLFDRLIEAKVPIGTACGGEQICGKCIFKAEPMAHISQESLSEQNCKDRNNVPSEFRLACHVTITDDITLTYPSDFPMTIDLQEPHSKE